MEIEAKFSIPDEQTFEKLLEATTLVGFSLGEMSVAELYDRYLDTADGDIRAGGYACRLRRRDDCHVATLKSMGRVSGAIHHRIEYEVELPDDCPPQDWPPSTARDLVLGLCHNKPLILLFEIEQTRHSRPLYDRDRTVAKLNLDHVRVRREGVEYAVCLEFEAELLPDGSEKDLERLSGELQKTWGLSPQRQSKFERGVIAVTGREAVLSAAPAERKEVELLQRPGIEPDDPMSEAGRKTFRFHYRRMLYHEPGTRLGEDIEELHDMRVATRRMRAAFRVFRNYYHPKVIQPYQKGLKQTGRALGAVRDLDVFRAEIQAHLDTLPESQQNSLDNLLASLQERRQAARQQMIAYLDSEEYRRFVEQFGEFVETEGLGSTAIDPDRNRPDPYRVRHVAPVAVYRRLAAVRAYDEWVAIPDPPLKRLHRLRIACKRLRYTLEFFREVLGPGTKAVVKQIVVIQDHLGALQDAVVASDILCIYLKYGTWGHKPTDETPTDAEVSVEDPGVEAYLEAKGAEMQHLLETFPEVWQKLQGAEFSRMVARVVAVL